MWLLLKVSFFPDRVMQISSLEEPKEVNCSTRIIIDCPSMTPVTVESYLHAWYELNGNWTQNATISGGEVWQEDATPALNGMRIQCRTFAMFRNKTVGMLDFQIYVILVQGMESLTLR